jgi:glycosyltransferase involved in cell wall biosynthesis
MRIAWVSSWSRVCGIADYSKSLWPEILSALKFRGHEGVLVSLDDAKPGRPLVDALVEAKPDLIHFQHDYGLYGGKNPPFYSFPAIVRELRSRLPSARILATAHTLLPHDYRYPVKGRGWQAPLRAAANALVIQRLNRLWGPETWGGLDAMVVHSSLQVEEARKSGARRVEAIPHFVPRSGLVGTVPRAQAAPAAREGRAVLVFGFFTPEKGQDVAIEAVSRLPSDVKLILAGGARDAKREIYRERCLARAREFKLMDRIEVQGYVDPRRIDALYARADVVLAPFRETTGSGSLAQGLARGSAILASDLPLNREIAEREPGALEFFRSEDPADLAARLTALLAAPERLGALRAAARRYAEAHAPQKMAERHLKLYGID